MKLEILKQRDTPLLSRTRVTLMVEHDGATPSRADLRKEIAKKIKADEELVILKHIYTRFGQKKSKIIANVYNNKEEMDKVESNYLLKKHKKEEKKEEAPAEKPAEEKAEAKEEEKKEEEKPAEDKKEEKSE